MITFLLRQPAVLVADLVRSADLALAEPVLVEPASVVAAALPGAAAGPLAVDSFRP